MRIEQSQRVYQRYPKSTAQAAPSKSFGQVMQARAQDRYVPSVYVEPFDPEIRAHERYVPNVYAEAFNPEINFSSAERAYGNPTIMNATCEKLKQLAEMDLQIDYTGMSDKEIYEKVYTEVWNRYDEAFDGNMIAIKAYITGPIEWERIHNQFYDDVSRRVSEARKAAGEVRTPAKQETEALEGSSQKGTGPASSNPLMKILGYDGMSFEEREAAIKEKYAGKNTVLDFLKMQSELKESGVLEHKMGAKADTYCAMMHYEFEWAFNPDYTKKDGVGGVNLHISTDQWNRIANQPFDPARLAVGMKENLKLISGPNGYTEDIVKMMEACIDRFISGAAENSIDHLLDEIGK